MKELYEKLAEIDERLLEILGMKEEDIANEIIDFCKMLPTKKDKNIKPEQARQAKIRSVFLLERLVDLEKPGQNRFRVLSFIDSTILALNKIISGERDGTILDETLVREAKVEVKIKKKEQELGAVLSRLAEDAETEEPDPGPARGIIILPRE